MGFPTWLSRVRVPDVPPHIKLLRSLPQNQLEVIRLPDDHGLIGGAGRWFSSHTPMHEPSVVQLPGGNRFWKHQLDGQEFLISAAGIDSDGDLINPTDIGGMARAYANMTDMRADPTEFENSYQQLLKERFYALGSDREFARTLMHGGSVIDEDGMVTNLPRNFRDMLATKHGLNYDEDAWFDHRYDGQIESIARDYPNSIVMADIGEMHENQMVALRGGLQVVPHPDYIIRDSSSYSGYNLDDDEYEYLQEVAAEEGFDSVEDYAAAKGREAYEMPTIIRSLYHP